MMSSPRKTRLTALVLGIAVAVVLAPAASAHHGYVAKGPGESVYVNPSTGYASPLDPGDDGVALEVASSSEGFDWASAAIGAAAGAGLLLILFASTIAMGKRGHGPLVRRGAVPSS